MKVKIQTQIAIAVIIFSLTSFSANAAGDFFTEESIADSRRYAVKYGELIENLREGRNVKKADIKSVFEGDPNFKRVDDGGHDTFKNKRFPVTLGVVSRKGGEVGKGERSSLTKRLQAYMNALHTGVFKRNEAISEKRRVAIANSITPERFNELYNEELRKYDVYSIEPQKNKKK